MVRSWLFMAEHLLCLHQPGAAFPVCSGLDKEVAVGHFISLLIALEDGVDCGSVLNKWKYGPRFYNRSMKAADEWAEDITSDGMI